MNGQSSIELIFVVSVAIMLSFMLLAKVFSVQESIFTSASIRQELISELEKLDTKYDVNNIHTLECPTSLKIDIEITPVPVESVQQDINSELVKSISSTRSTVKTIQIKYNDPATLICP